VSFFRISSPTDSGGAERAKKGRTMFEWLCAENVIVLDACVGSPVCFRVSSKIYK
jgi:hypothetical protein